MGKQEKIRGASVRALFIFRQIQRIKQEGLNRISVELQSLMNKLAEEKKLDPETIEILENVYLSRKSETETMEERINQNVESFRNELRGNKRDGIDRILLTLSDDGELYREPKQKHCYPMKKSGLRLNIICYLINEKTFAPEKI